MRLERILNAFCTDFRVYDDEIVFANFVGARNAVRAVLAKAQGRKKHDSVLRFTDASVFGRLPETYCLLQAVLDEKSKFHQCTLLEDRLTTRASVFKAPFLMDEDKTAFFHKLNKRLVIPLLPAWTDQLWERGLEESLIVPCQGFGRTVHYISVDKDSWLAIVKGILCV